MNRKTLSLGEDVQSMSIADCQEAITKRCQTIEDTLGKVYPDILNEEIDFLNQKIFRMKEKLENKKE